MTTAGSQQPCVCTVIAWIIKRGIGQACDISVAKQRLALNGKIMRGDAQLASFTIDDALCVTMVLVVVQCNLCAVQPREE